MSSPRAIIDLGTNTFHLLIAEVNGGDVKETFKLQIPVKIGKGGINQGRLSDDAVKRGLSAVARFREQLDKHKVSGVTAFATSAIRNASNGPDFVERVKQDYNIDIETISGDKEAMFIYNGVSHSLDMPDEPLLVMDIGGGSVEFIIGHKKEITWKHSFEVGAARLIDKFHRFDPMRSEDADALNEYLHTSLQPLEKALQKHPVSMLVGSAGSFETVVEVINHQFKSPCTPLGKNAFRIDLEQFKRFHELMLNATLAERERVKGMATFRAEMITVSAVLIRHVLERFGLQQLAASNYSLKEGVLFAIC